MKTFASCQNALWWTRTTIDRNQPSLLCSFALKAMKSQPGRPEWHQSDFERSTIRIGSPHSSEACSVSPSYPLNQDKNTNQFNWQRASSSKISFPNQAQQRGFWWPTEIGTWSLVSSGVTVAVYLSSQCRHLMTTLRTSLKIASMVERPNGSYFFFVGEMFFFVALLPRRSVGKVRVIAPLRRDPQVRHFGLANYLRVAHSGSCRAEYRKNGTRWVSCHSLE